MSLLGQKIAEKVLAYFETAVSPKDEEAHARVLGQLIALVDSELKEMGLPGDPPKTESLNTSAERIADALEQIAEALAPASQYGNAPDPTVAESLQRIANLLMED